MPGFDHEPAEERTFQSAEVSARNARYGLILFFIYLAIYVVFVLLNTFRPQVMDIVLAGVNVAIWYGLVLIVVPLVLALIYEWLCLARAEKPARHSQEGQR